MRKVAWKTGPATDPEILANKAFIQQVDTEQAKAEVPIDDQEFLPLNNRSTIRLMKDVLKTVQNANAKKKFTRDAQVAQRRDHYSQQMAAHHSVTSPSAQQAQVAMATPPTTAAPYQRTH